MTIKNINEAVTTANEIERYEAALKTMKDDLKKWVEENGPVDTGEKVWEVSHSQGWGFSPEKLKELAAEILMMGHNPWQYLSLAAKEIKKLELSEDILKQYGMPKITKRFGSKKSAVTAKGA